MKPQGHTKKLFLHVVHSQDTIVRKDDYRPSFSLSFHYGTTRGPCRGRECSSRRPWTGRGQKKAIPVLGLPFTHTSGRIGYRTVLVWAPGVKGDIRPGRRVGGCPSGLERDVGEGLAGAGVVDAGGLTPEAGCVAGSQDQMSGSPYELAPCAGIADSTGFATRVGRCAMELGRRRLSTVSVDVESVQSWLAGAWLLAVVAYWSCSIMMSPRRTYPSHMACNRA